VIACMDARLDPHAALGLREGDAHVIRNAGGVVTEDEIRSLAISQRIGGTREVMVIHHTDCGMHALDDEAFKREIEAETGVRPEWVAERFTDLDADVRESVARVRASPYLPHRDRVRGFVFDVRTGRLREVA
jgi:carbonic anhydrase